MVTKVPLYGSPLRAVQIDERATEGATLGVNLRWPDGRLVDPSDFTTPAPESSPITTTDDVEEGQWNLWFTKRRAQDAVGEILADSANVTLTYVGGESITANLTDLPDTDTGTLQAFTRDDKGRVTGTRDATITGTAGQIEVAHGDASDGLPTISLAEVTPTDGGTLQLTEFDAYGRRSKEGDATTDDLPEGANLYFTDARTDARITAAKSDPDGIASLQDGKLDPGQLPALAITETFVVADEAAMLALDCQQGDVAVRADEQKSYILTAEPASTLANWQELLTPTGSGVASFNGRTGSVVPASGDYIFAQIGDKPTTLSGYSITDAVPTTRTVNGKPLSANVTLAASDVGAEPAIPAGTGAQFLRGDKTWQTLNKATVGLGNVDNTSDANKPVSTAQAAAIGAKLDLSIARDAGIETTVGRRVTDIADLPSIVGAAFYSAANGAANAPAIGAAAGIHAVYSTGLSFELHMLSTASPRLFIGSLPGGAWNEAWTTGNFNPATKANTSGANFSGDVTILKSSAVVGVGLSSLNGGIANYGEEGSGYLGVFSNFSGGRIYLRPDGRTSNVGEWRLEADLFAPWIDNAVSIGSAGRRPSVIYAGTGTINTSDAREKTPVRPLTEAELAAAIELGSEIGVYKWLSMIDEKGEDGARLHVGMTVQRAIEVMESHGLDPMRYGFICYDEWDETPEQWEDAPEELDEDGNVAREASRTLVQEYRPAGNRYSFRTGELNLFLARGFAARLDALEGVAS